MESFNDGDVVRTEQAKEAALRNLRSQHLLTEAAVVARIEAVRITRTFGATWAEIGEATDTSRQLAHKRYGSAEDT